MGLEGGEHYDLTREGRSEVHTGSPCPGEPAGTRGTIPSRVEENDRGGEGANQGRLHDILCRWAFVKGDEPDDNKNHPSIFCRISFMFTLTTDMLLSFHEQQGTEKVAGKTGSNLRARQG